jgi:3-methyladenine DNA glycosylase Tag
LRKELITDGMASHGSSRLDYNSSTRVSCFSALSKAVSNTLKSRSLFSFTGRVLKYGPS